MVAKQGVGPTFHNDRTMSPREQEVLSAWAETGAAAGDPTKAPPPIEFVDGWNIEPDQVMSIPAYNVPADGVVEYTYYIVKNPFPEDRWVRMMELRPSNRSVVHHLVVYLRPPGSNFLKDYPAGEFFTADRETRNIGSEEQGGAVGFDFRQFLAAYVPGFNVAEQYAGDFGDRAVLVPAGSDLVFELHYTTTGSAGADQPSLGLVFADEPPAERALSQAVANVKFVIPPNAPNYKVEAASTVSRDVILEGLSPHMHYRGKGFEYRAVFPDGRTETLLSVPRYDFNWQFVYRLTEPIPLPRGTRIECTAWFDNSPNNPANPDASEEVRWGDQSWEQMMIGFLDIVVDVDQDPRGILDPIREEPDADAGETSEAGSPATTAADKQPKSGA